MPSIQIWRLIAWLLPQLLFTPGSGVTSVGGELLLAGGQAGAQLPQACMRPCPKMLNIQVFRYHVKWHNFFANQLIYNQKPP